MLSLPLLSAVLLVGLYVCEQADASQDARDALERAADMLNEEVDERSLILRCQRMPMPKMPPAILFYIQGDYASALRWYRLAADQGQAEAQFSLGRMYELGRGVPQEDAEAVQWYRLAADQGPCRSAGPPRRHRRYILPSRLLRFGPPKVSPRGRPRTGRSAV